MKTKNLKQKMISFGLALLLLICSISAMTLKTNKVSADDEIYVYADFVDECLEDINTNRVGMGGNGAIFIQDVLVPEAAEFYNGEITAEEFIYGNGIVNYLLFHPDFDIVASRLYLQISGYFVLDLYGDNEGNLYCEEKTLNPTLYNFTFPLYTFGVWDPNIECYNICRATQNRFPYDYFPDDTPFYAAAGVPSSSSLTGIVTLCYNEDTGELFEP